MATAVTDAGGTYRLPALPPGMYEITATLSGFSSAKVANVEILLGQIKKVELTLAVAGVSETVRVTVVRRGNERRTLDVRLVAAPTDAEQVASAGVGDSAAPAETAGKLGIAVDVPSADFLRQARLSEDQRGVVIADVEEGGPSWGKLYAPNQGGPEMVVAVNDVRVRSREEFQRALRAVRAGEVVQLRVYNVGVGQTRVVRIRARS